MSEVRLSPKDLMGVTRLLASGMVEGDIVIRVRDDEGVASALRKGPDLARELGVLDHDERVPWIEVDCFPPDSPTRQFAIWRRTQDVYRVGSDGAVEDDPVIPGPDSPHRARKAPAA